MKQIIYQIIYSSAVNKLIRNVNKLLSPILPKSVRIPPSGVVTIKNKKGKSLKIKTNQTSYLTKLIFWEGYENFEYTRLFLSLIKKVDVYFDIGANIGYYSLLAAMENPGIKVVAFEPAAGPSYYFKENLRLNNYHQITLEKLVLSEKEGEITFYEVKNQKYSYLEHNLAGEGNAGTKTKTRNFVPSKHKTTTLDHYLKTTEQSTVDLIKMDTEGTEHLILAHAELVLGKMKSIVICETLFNTNETQLQTIFSSYGYEFYNYSEGVLRKTPSLERTEDNGIRDCFFVHPSSFHLIEEYVI